MKIRTLGLLLGATALAGWGAGCEQPAIDCRAARGSFAAKYVLQTGTGECSKLKGDYVGLQSYYPATADNKSVDLSRSLLSVKAARIAEIEGEAAHQISEKCAETSVITKSNIDAVGDFLSVDPDANAVCTVPSSSVSEFQSNEIMPSGDPMDMDNACKGLAAQDLKYEWRNVRLLVSPDAPGTRFEADLTYTENGCSATYKVCGVWPAVDCAKYVFSDEEGDFVRTTEPEQKLCDAVADPEPAYGRPAGSGINEDFGAVCDPDTLLCVLPQCPIL